MTLPLGGPGQSALVMDAHSDLFNDIVDRRARGETQVLEGRHLPALSKGGVDVLVCAIYVESRFKPDRSLLRALNILDAIHCELAETPDRLRLCVNTSDIKAARAAGQLALLVSLEGAEPFGEDFAILRLMHRLGLRWVGLTWNQRNQVADGIAERRTHGRLTQYGQDLIGELNSLGMVIDLAHIAEEGFFDALEASQQPVVFSHGNCSAVCPHDRNLSDAQLEALASCGGVLGITFHPPLVSATDPSLEAVMQHIDHAVRIMGIDHVGIGGDFSDFIVWDPAEVGTGFAEEPKTEGLQSVSELPKLLESLLRHGYAPKQVAGLFGANFMRVVQEVIG
ncbi:dipeptidase [Candidatus Bipolaricaulota bacterium]